MTRLLIHRSGRRVSIGFKQSMLIRTFVHDLKTDQVNMFATIYTRESN